MQTKPDKKNTRPILWINEKSGNRSLIAIERTKEKIAATRTDIVVAFFQNNAAKKMTKIPGVNKPVKFWMYWNNDWKLSSNGATNTAINKPPITAILPTFIKLAWETS